VVKSVRRRPPPGSSVKTPTGSTTPAHRASNEFQSALSTWGNQQ
jgi:hypothetical protein